jgi:rhomboid protease GluP
MDQPINATFAQYIAQYYRSKIGYDLGGAPEVAPLAEASDCVLTLIDGFNVHILCIIDYDTNPNKRFDLQPETILEVAERCRIYTGSVNWIRGSVFVSLVEIGYAPSPERRERLSRYKTTSFFSKVRMMAFAIDEGSRSVWTNAPIQGGLQRRKFLSLLREQRLSQDKLSPRDVVTLQSTFPKATAIIAVLLTAMFVLEMAYGVGEKQSIFSPSLRTLAGLGGLIKQAVWNGEWYRFFLAPILHGNLLHLVLNLLALYLAGRVFERMVGWVWFAAVFVLGALGGTVGSLLWNEANVVAVGASGGISGLLAAGFICAHHFPAGPERTRLQAGFITILIPSLLPQISHTDLMKIDLGAHFAGAITGAVIGFFMLKKWPPEKPLPDLHRLAAGVVVTGLLALGASFMAVPAAYRQQVLALDLVPSHLAPDDDAAWMDQADRLVSHYPRDPRGRFAQGLKLLIAADPIKAEREIREGLSQKEILRAFFTPEFTAYGYGLLALTLYEQNKPEAFETAKLACGKLNEKHTALLTSRGLCP